MIDDLPVIVLIVKWMCFCWFYVHWLHTWSPYNKISVSCFLQSGCYGNTSDVSLNTFSGDRNASNILKSGPDDGYRIDYIFYRCTQGSLECVDCEVTMGRVPGKNFSFSDHEAVAASFVVKESALDKLGMKKYVPTGRCKFELILDFVRNC